MRGAHGRQRAQLCAAEHTAGEHGIIHAAIEIAGHIRTVCVAADHHAPRLVYRHRHACRAAGEEPVHVERERAGIQRGAVIGDAQVVPFAGRDGCRQHCLRCSSRVLVEAQFVAVGCEVEAKFIVGTVAIPIADMENKVVSIRRRALHPCAKGPIGIVPVQVGRCESVFQFGRARGAVFGEVQRRGTVRCEWQRDIGDSRVFTAANDLHRAGSIEVREIRRLAPADAGFEIIQQKRPRTQ